MVVWICSVAEVETIIKQFKKSCEIFSNLLLNSPCIICLSAQPCEVVILIISNIRRSQIINTYSLRHVMPSVYKMM